jgi:hypothetical protein
MSNAIEYPKKRYGVWAENPEGHAYKPDKCAKEVWMNFQCPEDNGHGKDGLFCKQHAKQHPEG